MKKVILAELRKSWRGKRVFVAFAVFLYFFSVVYVNCLQKGKTYKDDLIVQLHHQSVIVSTRCGDLVYTLQNTPVEKEDPNQRKETYGQCDVAGSISNWTYLRQVPGYFGWHNTDVYIIGCAETLFALIDRSYYHGELKDCGITEKTPETGRAYYRYFEAQDVPPYMTSYESNLLDLILRMSQYDTILLLIVVVLLLMVDQTCYDYDSDTYKVVYSQPISRKKLTTAKASAAATIILLIPPAALTVFFVAPLSTYGMGSSVYSYIIHTYDVVSWMWLLQRILPFSLLVILLYMTMTVLLAS